MQDLLQVKSSCALRNSDFNRYQVTIAGHGRQHHRTSHVMFAIARDCVGSLNSSSCAAEQLGLFKEAHAIQTHSTRSPLQSASHADVDVNSASESSVLTARCALLIELYQVTCDM